MATKGVPAESEDATEELDSLIAVEEALTASNEARGTAADHSSTTLMTTALSLGVALVAGSSALKGTKVPVPELPVWVSCVGLVIAFLFGGALRAGRMAIRLAALLGHADARRLKILKQNQAAVLDELRAMAVLPCAEGVARGPVAAKRLRLELCHDRAEIAYIYANAKWRLLRCGGGALVVTLLCLVVIGRSVLRDAWP